MRKIIAALTVVLLFFAIFSENADSYGKRIILLPFYDESGYRGPWQIHNEVPIMLGDMLMDDYYFVVDLDSVINIMGPPPKPKSIFSKFINLFANRKNKQKIAAVEEKEVEEDFRKERASRRDWTRVIAV